MKYFLVIVCAVALMFAVVGQNWLMTILSLILSFVAQIATDVREIAARLERKDREALPPRHPGVDDYVAPGRARPMKRD